MTDSTRADFEAWLDRPSSHNPDTSMRKRSTAMERAFALHAWQAAAQGKRQPLTDEQITQASWKQRDELLDFIYEYGTAAEGVSRRVVAIARAVEAAHGITATPPTGTEQS